MVYFGVLFCLIFLAQNYLFLYFCGQNQLLNKIMKRKNSISILLVSALFAGCSSSNIDGNYVDNVSRTDCLRLSRTRTDGSMEEDYRTVVRLTREGNNIVGEIRNYSIECSHRDLFVQCKQNGSELHISVKQELPKGDGDFMSTNCNCMVNIYFTMHDIEGDLFHVYLEQRDFGNASFKEGSIAELTQVE